MNNDPEVNSTHVIPTAASTQATTEIELSLEDKFLEHHLLHSIEVTSVVGETLVNESSLDPEIELKAEAYALPHVLVDEELMKELASIPDRFGFKIGDVADLLEIKQYVLRYWEQEFDLLKPKKASNNQRLYTKKDVENAFLIRKLLYRDKFSIEGARQALKDVKFAVKKEKDFNQVIQKIDSIQEQIKGFVEEIRKTKKIFSSL